MIVKNAKVIGASITMVRIRGAMTGNLGVLRIHPGVCVNGVQMYAKPVPSFALDLLIDVYRKHQDTANRKGKKQEIHRCYNGISWASIGI